MNNTQSAGYRGFINSSDNVKDTLATALDYLGWKGIVQSDDTVFVKPNFTFPRYKQGVTTNPILLKELLIILKDRADRVILGESNGGRNSFTAYEAFRGHQMDGICNELGVELVNLTSVPAKLVKDKVLNRLISVY